MPHHLSLWHHHSILSRMRWAGGSRMRYMSFVVVIPKKNFAVTLTNICNSTRMQDRRLICEQCCALVAAAKKAFGDTMLEALSCAVPVKTATNGKCPSTGKMY
jgi:hypothetical protein